VVCVCHIFNVQLQCFLCFCCQTERDVYNSRNGLTVLYPVIAVNSQQILNPLSPFFLSFYYCSFRVSFFLNSAIYYNPPFVLLLFPNNPFPLAPYQHNNPLFLSTQQSPIPVNTTIPAPHQHNNPRSTSTQQSLLPINTTIPAPYQHNNPCSPSKQQPLLSINTTIPAHYQHNNPSSLSTQQSLLPINTTIPAPHQHNNPCSLSTK